MPLNPTRIRSIESDPDLQKMIEQLNRYIHELDYLGTTNDTQRQTKTLRKYIWKLLFNR
jgi:hypothetical protein